MKVYFYVGFFGDRRVEGEIVHWYSTVIGRARAVIKIEKNESENNEYRVGRFVTRDTFDLHSL